MTDRPPTGATPPADSAGFEPGAILAGRYRIIELLGVGAMGAVYLAEHMRIGRKDAIKVLNADLAGDREAIARFTRGARNVSAIRHPNICTIYDFSDTADGVTFLAMEYVPGETLRDVLQRDGALPLERAVHIVMQSALALQAAHDAGIVHRDLKPANIMISRGQAGLDAVKVVDFDIAKGPAEGAGEEVTRMGFVVGTPEYMSPEQLMGEPLDGRSDLYSLALVLFRALTGALPFQADNTQDLMIRRLTERPLRLDEARPDLGFAPALQVVLDRALERKAADRHANAAAFAEDLARAVRGGAAAPAAPQSSAGDARAGTRATTTAPAPGDAEPLPPTRVAGPAAAASPRVSTTTPAPQRAMLYRIAAGAAALVIALLAVLLYSRAQEDGAGGLAGVDAAMQAAAADTGVAPDSAGEAGDEPAGGEDGGQPTEGGAPAGSRGDAEDPPAGTETGDRDPATTGGGATDTEPEPRGGGEDPAALAREDSLALWRHFERLGAMDLEPAALAAIMDSARSIYGKQVLPSAHRAFAAYIAGLASVELGDIAACALWLERAVRLRPDGPGYQEQLDACRGPGP